MGYGSSHLRSYWTHRHDGLRLPPADASAAQGLAPKRGVRSTTQILAESLQAYVHVLCTNGRPHIGHQGVHTNCSACMTHLHFCSHHAVITIRWHDDSQLSICIHLPKPEVVVGQLDDLRLPLRDGNHPRGDCYQGQSYGHRRCTFSASAAPTITALESLSSS